MKLLVRPVVCLRRSADVKTQGGYQYLDDSFVGVIFSVFSTAGAGQDSVSLSAFQAAQVRPWSVRFAFLDGMHSSWIRLSCTVETDG